MFYGKEFRFVFSLNLVIVFFLFSLVENGTSFVVNGNWLENLIIEPIDLSVLLSLGFSVGHSNMCFTIST